MTVSSERARPALGYADLCRDAHLAPNENLELEALFVLEALGEHARAGAAA